MTEEEALLVVEKILATHLSNIQNVVFEKCWQGKTYAEIANDSGYDAEYIKQVGFNLWQQLTKTLGTKVNKNNIRSVIQRYSPSPAVATPEPINPTTIATKQPDDLEQITNYKTIVHPGWIAALDVGNFYGRTTEINTLTQSIVRDRCRLLTVTGMGGIGKTSLVARTAEQIKYQFEHLVWYSLRNAPSIEDILLNLIQILSHQQENQLPETLDSQISRLIHYLHSTRCLIVLDNLETILLSGDRGRYRQAYEGYGQLLRVIAETNHTSCVIVTSREMPIGLSFKENTAKVRLLKLTGLPQNDAQTIFKTKGILVSETESQLLCQRYQGNPLALKIVATTIQNLFASQVERFLVQEITIFGDIRGILEQQFQRLSELEMQIMYWLAIKHKPCTIEQLQADIVPFGSISTVIEALESLDRRSLVEISPTGFTQQSVVMEYVKDLFIEQIYTEINTGKLKFFARYALIEADTQDYIRETQIRVILEPIINKLTARYSITEIEKQLKQILAILRETSTFHPGYGGGNLLNILRQLEINPTGWDFSHLSVWQAYLQDVSLHQVNLAYADIKRCVFAATFGGITSVAFSSDGQCLATSDTNGDLQIWSTVKNRQIATYKGHSNWVWCVVYSSDRQLLASAGQDHTVKLWNTSTHQQLNNLQGHTSIVTSVGFSPDNKTLVSSSMDKTIKLWDVKTNKCKLTLIGHEASVWSAVISPDGQTIASTAEDRTIKLWDIHTGICLQTLTGHTEWVKSVSFSPDGEAIATSSFDRTVKLWHVSTGKCLKTLQGHSDAVVSVCFSPDGQTIATGSYDRTVKLWHVSTGKCLKTLQAHTSRVWSVTFSPNGSQLASGGDDRTAIIWDIDTGYAVSKFQGHSNCTYALALSPNRQILASAHEDQTLKLWLVRSQQTNPSTYECKYFKALHGHSNRIFAVAFSPDGSILASCSGDRTIKLWDVETWRCFHTFKEHTSWVWSLAFSPDGKTLASGSYDRTVKLWNIKTGKCINTLTGHPSSLLSVAFSPDGTLLASSGYEQVIKLWDVLTGECLKTWEAHQSRVWCVAFSPDGTTLATAGDDRIIRLWAIDTGECLQALNGHSSQVMSLQFDDNELIVSSSGDNTIKTWDVKTGKCLHTLQGHNHFVWSIDVLQELQIIISGSQDNTIKFWDLKTGECLNTLGVPRPYEGTNIIGVTGLTETEIISLKLLGSVETKDIRVVKFKDLAPNCKQNSSP